MAREKLFVLTAKGTKVANSGTPSGLPKSSKGRFSEKDSLNVLMVIKHSVPLSFRELKRRTELQTSTSGFKVNLAISSLKSSGFITER